jgi:hypothetical protein
VETTTFRETLIAAVLALPLLLYLPGLLVSRALLPASDALTRHYERVTLSAMLSGWLALVLASFGVFSLWLHLAVLLLGCGGLAWAARRRAPPPGGGSRRELAAFALLGALALALVLPPFEAVLGARDAGVYANTGAAIARTGSLVQYDPLIAEMGQQAQANDPAVRGPAEQALTHFLGVQHPERFIATRLYTAGFFIHEGDATAGRIVPQHVHMASAWIGLLTSALGFTAGLAAPGLMAVLGAWSVGMLGRRLIGPWVGGLAFLLLALNSVQVWFGRYPTSETTAQFFLFAGLYFFARWQTLDSAERAAVPYAALTGLAFGMAVLTRIDALLLVALLAPFLLYHALTHRWQATHTALTLGLGAMLLHAALHITFIARAYFFDTAFARLQDYAITSYLALPFVTPLIREVYHTTSRSPLKDPLQLWSELAVLALLLLALLALWRWPQPLFWLEGWLRRWRALLVGALALLVLLLAGYAYFVRPQILAPETLAALPRCLLPQQWQVTPESAGACLTLQGYIGAPIDLPPPPPGLDEKYMIPLANFVRFGWYLSPLGIVLGVAGFAAWLVRDLNRASWLFLLAGFLGTFLFVRDTYGTSDQSYIYILRRFVPLAYPAFSLAMAYALVSLARWGRAQAWPQPWRHLPLATSAGLALLLVSFFAWTGRPIYRHVEYQGVIAELEQVAQRFAEDDVLLLRGGAPTYGQARDIPDLIATPLRFAAGVNALPIKSSNPGAYADALAAQVRYWQQEGRTVYAVLSASGGSFALPGFDLEPVGSFRLRLPEFEQLTDQKPRNVAILNLAFDIYRLTDAPPGHMPTLALPLQPDDFAAQVRGFYLPEPAGPTAAAGPLSSADTYAWTDGDALLRIPWPTGQRPDELRLQAAGGERPAHLGPARLCLSLLPETTPWPTTSETAAAWHPLGCLTLDTAMQRYRLPLEPGSLPTAPSGSALLRLESNAWVPAAEDPSFHDERPVGVQFGGLYRSRAAKNSGEPAP